ncbi:polyphosphate polymerase domain-containing protein [Eubacteriales bacterium OttesenSCG-928-K08]|nr:polyphosphate polymerase domain-containing protein [Eubacteriales bacterium OttesenSCG-928-K08]
MAKEATKTNMIFERHEKKFMVRPDQFAELTARLDHYMEQDQYGLHTISTVYFDTEDYSIIRHSLDKPSFKEKLRLRSYGTPGADTTVYLELKKKLHGVTYKRRMPMPLYQAREYLEQGIVPSPNVCNTQTFGEIDWFIKQVRPSPKVLLSYDRIALYGKEDKQLRMTFDANVRWRDHHLDLGQGDYGNLLITPGIRLLEIKTLDALPLWLCRLLCELSIYPQSFSKYGAVYSEHLINPLMEVIRSA